MAAAYFTAEICYEAHRNFLHEAMNANAKERTGIKFSSRNVNVPKLENCPVTVRAAWYGMACFQTLFAQAKLDWAKPEDTQCVPVPAGVTPELAAAQRKAAHAKYLQTYSFGRRPIPKYESPYEMREKIKAFIASGKWRQFYKNEVNEFATRDMMWGIPSFKAGHGTWLRVETALIDLGFQKSPPEKLNGRRKTWTPITEETEQLLALSFVAKIDESE